MTNAKAFLNYITSINDPKVIEEWDKDVGGSMYVIFYGFFGFVLWGVAALAWFAWT